MWRLFPSCRPTSSRWNLLPGRKKLLVFTCNTSSSTVKNKFYRADFRCRITCVRQKRLSSITLHRWPLSCTISPESYLKDVRTHCYCASLVRTLCMTWHVSRHVFQARTRSRNSIKYRAGDLCGNLICEYFCWIIGDPHFFFGRSLPFLILSIILKTKKICVWEVLIISYTLFK